MGKTPARKEQKYWGKGHKWVSIRDLRQKIITETKEEITDLALKESGIKMVSKGTLLFSFKLTIGKMAFAGTNLYTNEAIAAFVIKDPNKVDSNYLYYALKSANLVGSNQAAMGKTLNSKSLAAIEIPLPDNINDQKCIAHLLGKVEGCINERKHNIQQLDELLKSLFLEMFGDPKSNPYKYPVKKLSNFYANSKEGTKCGPFGSALKKDEYVNKGVAVWNMDNIDPAGRMISPFRMWITSEKYGGLSSYSVIDEDVIISRAGTVGKMCVAKMNGETSIISTNLIRLRFGPNLRPLYFVSLMTYCRSRVGRLKVGPDGTFTHMNTGILDKLEFPCPPLELQDTFASIVEKTEKIRTNYQQNLIDLETLYSCLSQKAFNGDLDLSNIPLPEELDATVEPANQFTDEFISDPLTGTKPLIMPLLTHNEYPLSDPISRRQVLEYAFATFLNNIQTGDEISLAEFWQTLLWQAGDYADETDLPFNVNDYDLVKKQLFQAIADGKVEQQINKIQLQNEVTDGNQILLKKLG
jgi:type I restriction enzyme S subunit